MTPDPTPNAKRVKISGREDVDNEANKENLAPDSRLPATPPPTPLACVLPVHSRVRSLLRSTSIAPFSLQARNSEHLFINSFLHESDNNTLYISGSPGTGKTALVNAVLRDQANVIFINCMAVNSTEALCEQLIEELPSVPNNSRKLLPKDSLQCSLASLHTKWFTRSFLPFLKANEPL
jgi:cell division control protein 6